jgi:tRNA 5-methylaminomethyl-2-thiouridine biosynthesis bifunctional protein
MPRLDVGDGPASRALLEAWLYARRFYPDLGPEATQVLDAVHLPRGDREIQRFAKLLADPPLEDALLQAEGAGLRHRGAVAVKPAEALPRLLAGAELRFGQRVAALYEIDADLVVVCAGMGVAALDVNAPAIEGRLGQVAWIASEGAAQAVADGGYAVQAFGQLVFGATFEAADGEPRVSDTASAHNLDVLKRLRPEVSVSGTSSRAAIRATTQDRLPFAGRTNEKAPDGTPAPSGRHRLIGGLGSRGFLWAPLLAELVASEALGEPLPVEGSVADGLDPGRFVARAAKRGNSFPTA